MKLVESYLVYMVKQGIYMVKECSLGILPLKT